MTQIQANGISIEYETRGSSENPALMWICGLGSQLVHYPDEYFDMLAAHGVYVVRFDNRDVGLSTKFDGQEVPPPSEIVSQAKAGRPVELPYSLFDMVADVVGLMDALNIEQAHIAGISMGGMIAQLTAAEYPKRVVSLCSIMSTTGDPSLPTSSPEAIAALTKESTDTSREAVITDTIEGRKTYASTAYPYPEEKLRDIIGCSYDRSYYPEGQTRQYAAVIANGDRSPLLSQITAPTLVIHGSVDTLVRPDGGKDTAKKIKDAQFELIDGMGHDMPPGVLQLLADLIGNHAKAAH